MNKKRVYPTIVAIVLIVVFTIGTPIAKGQELDQQELEVNVDEMRPDKDVNDGQDPRDPDVANFIQWQRDFHTRGKESPKGAYVGQYFKPSTFELDYKPVSQSKKDGGRNTDPFYGTEATYSYTTGTYGITVVSETIEFSSNDIMNGVSEFWVRLPGDGNQLTTIDQDMTAYTRYNNDLSNDTDITFEEHRSIHSGFYIFEGKHQEFTINGNKTGGIFDLRGEEIGNIPMSEYSKMNSVITENDIYNGSIYHKVNGIIRPDQKYTFSFLMITEDKPLIKVDEVSSDTSTITMKTLEMTGSEYVPYAGISYDEGMLYRKTLGLLSEFKSVSSDKKNIPLSPHFSFVFTKGIGYNNMFGCSLEDKGNVALSTKGNIGPDENQNYPSFYVPFKYSAKDSYIQPELGVTIANGTDVFERTYNSTNLLHPYDWSTRDGFWRDNLDYGFEFKRFMLYSSTNFGGYKDVYQDNYTGEVNIIQTFKNLPQNFTFLAKERKDFEYKKDVAPQIFETEIRDEFGNLINTRDARFQITRNWMGEKFRVYDEGQRYPFDYDIEKHNESGVDYIDVEVNSEYNKMPERYFYDVHSSFEMTEGRWNTIKLPPKVEYIDAKEAVKRGIPEDGLTINTRHRDYIVEVEGDVESYERADENPGLASRLPDNPFDNPLETVSVIGNYVVERITSTISALSTQLRNVGESIYSRVASLAQSVWEGIKDIGSWIHRTVMNFVDFITSLASHIYELGYAFASAFQYTLGVMALTLGLFGFVVALDSLKIRINKIRGGGRQ